MELAGLIRTIKIKPNGSKSRAKQALSGHEFLRADANETWSYSSCRNLSFPQRATCKFLSPAPAHLIITSLAALKFLLIQPPAKAINRIPLDRSCCPPEFVSVTAY